MLDLASGSRVGFVAGLGYREEEFSMAGVDRKARGRLLEEYVQVLRQAWSGEPFEWRGRTIRVTPRPRSEPLMLVGGSTAAAARRAARLRLGFFPAIGDAQLADIYQAECARLGFTGFGPELSSPSLAARRTLRCLRAILLSRREVRAMNLTRFLRQRKARPAEGAGRAPDAWERGTTGAMGFRRTREADGVL